MVSHRAIKQLLFNVTAAILALIILTIPARRAFHRYKDRQSERLMPERLLRIGRGERDILVGNVFDYDEYDHYCSILTSFLATPQAYVVLRDEKFQLVRELRAGDYLITREEIEIRNAAILYNWFIQAQVPDDVVRSEAMLQKYGLIMEKLDKHRYVPVYLKSGERLEFPPRREVAELAIRIINKTSKLYGTMFISPTEALRLMNPFQGYEDMLFVRLSAKEILDISGASIQWNSQEESYQIAKEDDFSPYILSPPRIVRNFDPQLSFRMSEDQRNPIVTVNDFTMLNTYYIDLAHVSIRHVPGLQLCKRLTGKRDLGDYAFYRKRLPSLGDMPIENAIVKEIYYTLLAQTSSSILLKSCGTQVDVKGQPVKRDTNEMMLHSALEKYYSSRKSEWEKLLKEGHNISITWTQFGFEPKNTETGQKIAFPRDDDLLNEALKELNYYKEKCDFVNYFQIENYPMFLLAILRLYGVNLELDRTTNKYVLAPGPTDPKKFFEIVAEFTFVDSKDDIEYLKKNLKSWKD